MSMDRALEARIKELAQKIYEERTENGIAGTSESDWEKACNMIVGYENIGSDPNSWSEK